MFFQWRRGLVFWSLVFIVIGVLIWLGNLGIFSFRWGRDWPVLFLIFGLYLLVRAIPGKRRRDRKKPRSSNSILSRLERGDITAERAAEEMEE